MQLGFSYDWSREIDSTDPDYYKWTQWFFLLLFKKGLAYQKEALVNWDPIDKTVLANEQVIDGKAERSGAVVEKKSLKQWFFKITDYADRLLDDLDDLDWSEAIKAMQRNWIGRSRGAEIKFKIKDKSDDITIFTTRHDTQFGVTFMVLAPEHALVKSITTDDQKKVVEEYIDHATRKSELERQSENDKTKTGVFTGAYAFNPANNEEIPIWIADYVLVGYGTGAVMGVPAHDDRDFAFAKKYELPIRKVIEADKESDFHSEGVIINSDKYNGLRSEVMREKILQDFVENGIATEVVQYKMRDWLISRQRYWGAPIPIIHCPIDGAVAVPEDQLPVVLPDMKSYEPSGDGRSPLANVPEFVNTKCPTCGGDAERETDTMDGFACSSWYFLRFADPHNSEKAFSKEMADFWLPVDDYIGGAEHAVMHLLYARFWTKVMFDDGLINFQEPFTTLRNHGMILAPNGLKMSKSKSNTIEPDEIIDQGYGADSIRIMELFIGPWNQTANWSVEGMGGAYRFLQRVWTLVGMYQESKSNKSTSESTANTELIKKTNQVIKTVTQDLRHLGFNTSIASLMEYVNDLYKIKEKDAFADIKSWDEAVTGLLQLLAPFAPHITEELWNYIGNTSSIHLSEWPTYDEALLIEETVTIVIQVNGKLRGDISVARGTSEDEAISQAKQQQNITKYLENQTIRKTIFVKDKLINFVI